MYTRKILFFFFFGSNNFPFSSIFLSSSFYEISIVYFRIVFFLNFKFQYHLENKTSKYFRALSCVTFRMYFVSCNDKSRLCRNVIRSLNYYSYFEYL